MRERLAKLAAILSAHRYGGVDEATIQRGVASILLRYKDEFFVEYKLGPRDRLDFLVRESGIGIEVKVNGGRNALLRQLQRYMQHDAVRGLIVVTNRARLLDMPAELSGKPIAVASLLAGGL